MTDLGF